MRTCHNITYNVLSEGPLTTFHNCSCLTICKRYLELLCHDFFRSRCLSLFGRCLAVDVTGLLAIIDPFIIFHWFLSCLPTHLVPIPFITCCVFNPLFPLMSLSEIVCLYICVLCIGTRWVLLPTFILSCIFDYGVLSSLLNDSIYTKFDSPAPDFPATYTHDYILSPSLNCLEIKLVLG